MKRSILAILCCAACCASAAQTVYKCTVNGTTTYSQQPCAKDSRAMKQTTYDSSAPIHSSGSAMSAGSTEDQRAALSKGVAMSQAGIDESSCIIAAENSIYGPSNNRIAELRSRRAGLEAKAATANNNLAGATYESGLRSEMGSIDTAISTEQASAAAQASAARAQCADQRKRQEDAINKPAAAQH